MQTDSNGKEYFELCTAFNSKNHQGGTGGRDNSQRCKNPAIATGGSRKATLVQTWSKDRSDFPNSKNGLGKKLRSPFSGMPHDKNTIKVMVKRTSEKAGLSIIYTNYCVRTTAINGWKLHAFLGNQSLPWQGTNRWNHWRYTLLETRMRGGQKWQSSWICSHSLHASWAKFIDPHCRSLKPQQGHEGNWQNHHIK